AVGHRADFDLVVHLDRVDLVPVVESRVLGQRAHIRQCTLLIEVIDPVAVHAHDIGHGAGDGAGHQLVLDGGVGLGGDFDLNAGLVLEVGNDAFEFHVGKFGAPPLGELDGRGSVIPAVNRGTGGCHETERSTQGDG